MTREEEEVREGEKGGLEEGKKAEKIDREEREEEDGDEVKEWRRK